MKKYCAPFAMVVIPTSLDIISISAPFIDENDNRDDVAEDNF